MDKQTVSGKQLALTVIVLVIAVFGIVALTVHLTRLPPSPVAADPQDSDPIETDTSNTTPETDTAPPEESAFVFSFVGNFSPTSFGGGSVFGTFNHYFLETGATAMIESLQSYLESDAFSIGSLAGVLSDNELAEAFINTKPYFHMKGPSAASAVLSKIGLNAVAVTNDHCLDYGTDGFSDTVSAITAQELTPLENQTIYTVTENGITVAVLLVASDTSDPSFLSTLVASASANYDYLIVYDASTNSLEDSTTVRTLYRELVDQGADFVVGVHGESIFASELYNGVSIFPAIGTFLSGIEPVSKAFMLRVTFIYENERIIQTRAELIPFRQNPDWTYTSLENTDEGRTLLSEIKP